MKEKEILEMQRLIDEGVRKAQYRLLQRAHASNQSLVVVPDVEPNMSEGSCGDPLARRKQR